jgi:hypothetical protein
VLGGVMVGLRRGAQTVVSMLAIALVAATATDADAAPRGFYGVSSQTHLEAGDFQRMGKGRVGTLRSMLSWAGANPTQNGGYSWWAFDAIVADAARNGITVLPFVYGTPDWVAKGLDGRNCGSRCAIFAPRSDPARRAWADFVGAAAERYGSNGRFWSEHPDLPRKPIRAWQIWNEQNSKSFFRPKPSTKTYAKMLDAAAGAIRAGDRRAAVVLGGMAELAGSRKAVPGPKYLKKLYRRKGVKKNFDGLGVHPYGAKLGSVIGQVNRFRKAAKRARDPRAQLWITELGWGSASGGNPLNVGKKGQADRLKQAFRYFGRKRNKLNVKNVTWFSWRDSKARVCEWCPKSGLFSKGFKPKPSWRAFKRAAR